MIDDVSSDVATAIRAGLLGVAPDNLDRQLSVCMTEDVAWCGSHPLGERRGHAALRDGFYAPLFAAFPDLERRDDVFFGGRYGDGDWLAAMGHYVGRFKRDWLGIPATGALTFIRYGEFFRLAGDRISEAYVQIDFIDVMRQAGVRLLPSSLGSPARVPGPATQDGIVTEPQNAADSHASLMLVSEMLTGLRRYDAKTDRYDVMEHERFWHPQMMWYGPAGIGTTRGIDGFIEQHQRPFLTAFPDRKGGDDNHTAHFANGHYVATFGWPNMSATHTGGGWLGCPPTNRPVTMRVMDFWRREGELLRENWVLIDLPDLLLQMGLDIFGMLAQRNRFRR